MKHVSLRTLVCAITLALCAGNTAAVASAAQRENPRLARHHRRHHRRHRGRRPHDRDIAMPRDYLAWSRVAGCESGGWRVLGYAYPDSLGIDRANWLQFGGRPMPPGYVSPASRAMEIRVADRLVAYYHAAIPDQYGCASW